MAYDDIPVIEIVGGREALWGIRNRDLVPMGGLAQFRNGSLEDHTWRTVGGAALHGSAPAAAKIMAAMDYWPDTATQRELVMMDDGTLRKGNGSGGGWVTLATGLTVANAVPYWSMGGQEVAANTRRAFYCDGVNAPQVLSADGVATAALSAPAADWSGTNQPLFLTVHEGFMWGGGNLNAPHTVYRSLLANHQNFTGTPFSIPLDSGIGERVVGAISYKGGLLVFKYPEGVWFIDTSDPTPTNWRAVKVAEPGAVAASAIVLAEDDVFWLSADGTWHRVQAVTATGSVRASDLSFRKLGSLFRDQINRSRLNFADLRYYSNQQRLLLACSASGATAKSRLVTMDLLRRDDLGERWGFGDRDNNEALFMRKVNNVLMPAFGDASGQLWNADQANRNANGLGYTFEWWTSDSDFGPVNPAFRGRKKNLRYIALQHDPRGSATHTVEIWLDGALKQTIQFTLAGAGATLPATLPLTLGGSSLVNTRRRRATGQFTRMALRGYSTAANEDVSIARLFIGAELAEGAGQPAVAA